ncbi:HlyC/CorC family transporter [Solimonas sp. K1W22B-7]|uniref:hemolysin family protein n=1 Tax=Solimonas sp. K1W22B-7 TaxID=2303331 RepID=UPI000E334A1B|nr:hemolysin family protein [Solimonas sp. K1W22B-7]AXQ27233.1 HlyC/CorC family transporter [Solimonas sp. K1W22B-7]
MLFDLLVVVALVLLNGVLAMSELAVVSSRKGRLQAMQQQGIGGARTALELHNKPGRFLSTVQIGITAVGVFAGAYSGAVLAEPLAAWFVTQGIAPDFAGDLALGLVVASITYLSLIVGELVPKQLALRNPERVAVLVAPPMLMLSRLAAPLVWLLEKSSATILALLPRRREGEVRVTDEEIHALVEEAASSGVVRLEEQNMIAGVMRLGDRSVRALMTPRQQLDWLDLDEPLEAQHATLRASSHTKLLAGRGDVDHFVGLVSAKHLIDAMLDGADGIDPARHVQEALVVPDSLDAVDAMRELRDTPLHAAIVVDEFGSLQGLITVTDVLSAIAGEFHRGDEPRPGVRKQDDGSWLVDGKLSVDEMASILGLRLPEERDYETAAGLVLNELGHIPRRGEILRLGDWRVEVVALDGRRIDKLRVCLEPDEEESES